MLLAGNLCDKRHVLIFEMITNSYVQDVNIFTSKLSTEIAHVFRLIPILIIEIVPNVIH